MAVAQLDLAGFERLDHALLLGHAADPAVGFDGHGAVRFRNGWAVIRRAETRRVRADRLAAGHVFCTTIFGMPSALLRARRDSRAAALRAIPR